MIGSAITGWASALPPDVVTNAELEARLDTTDEWITTRTGIRERHVGTSTTALAVACGRDAVGRAGLSPADLDAIIVATCTPDEQMPATAAYVQAALGATGAAFDVNVACSGFVQALIVAFGLLELGHRRILVIGAETMSRIVDPNDRNTAVLFADGAGAVVVEATAGPSALLAHATGNDPSGLDLIASPLGGPLRMDGREVFRRAVRLTVEMAESLLADAGLAAEDVALAVPHQANLRIIDAAAERLAIPRDHWASVLEHTGNTSAASVPLALVDAADAGRIDQGDAVLLLGFGAGMSWAGAAVRWGTEQSP